MVIRSEFLDLLHVFLKQFLWRPFLVTHRVTPRSRLHSLSNILTFQKRQFRLGTLCHTQTSSMGLSLLASEPAWVCFALLFFISFSSSEQMRRGQQIIPARVGCSYIGPSRSLALKRKLWVESYVPLTKSTYWKHLLSWFVRKKRMWCLFTGLFPSLV